MQRIDLIPEDDIVSILDRLDWAAEQRLLLVLPDDGRLLTSPVDLARLRRQADRLRQEIGLVTLDFQLAKTAADYGCPTFRSVEQAEPQERRWRRGRRRREKAGLSPAEVRQTMLNHADQLEVQRRRRERPVWNHWIRRYAAIALFCLTAAFFFVAVVYAVPGGTITIEPFTRPLHVTQDLVADPQLEKVNLGGASIPARLLVVEAEWQTEVATTGSVDVPDAPARGKVVFINKIDQAVTVPAGTRVSTTAGDSRVRFETVQPAAVPPVTGGTVEVDVIAVDPGPQGNVPANQINLVEGSLALQLEVRNLEATAGGGLRPVPAVSQADLDRLRGQVTQYLQSLAANQMESQLEETEFLARDSVRLKRIAAESQSHFVGEATPTVALQMRGEIQGTAVDTNQALDIVYNRLIEAIQPGFTLLPESFRFFNEEVHAVDGEGRVHFTMVGLGTLAAKVDLQPLLREVSGQEIDPALDYLHARLPLQSRPTARVVPDWFGRLPYLPSRIQIVTSAGGSPEGGP